jgi:Holliday junction resolvase-like predicted endonuclease
MDETAGPSGMLGSMVVSYPRIQQLRRLRRAGVRWTQAGLSLAGALALATAGLFDPAVVLLALALVLSADGAHAAKLAKRSAVGADSEAAVRRALAALRRQGWTVQHGVYWPGGGDIDHVVRSPRGLGFAIETKTRSYDPSDLARTAATARWLARRRRFPRGVHPVLCRVRVPSQETVEADVLVVSLSRLVRGLRRLADESANGPPPRPASEAGP